MDTKERDPAHEALLRAIAEQRKANPLVGAQLAANEVFLNLTESMKQERGVHVETLLCALASLAGYACLASVRSTAKLNVAQGADGKRYFFGNELNAPLAQDEYSVWSLCAGKAQSLGVKDMPDLDEIFGHVASTVGGPSFGTPRIAAEHRPAVPPIKLLTILWPKFLPLLKEYCAKPSEWPLVFAYAICKTMEQGKGVIDPAEALRMVMECAIPMSKVDLLPKAESTGTVLPQRPRSSPPSSRPTARPLPSSYDDDADSPPKSKARAKLILFSAGFVAFLYYAFVVWNFEPSKAWENTSVIVGIAVGVLLTVLLAHRMFKADAFARFSVLRVITALIVFCALMSWLLYLASAYIVGDAIARSFGSPTITTEEKYVSSTSVYLPCLSQLVARVKGGRRLCVSADEYKPPVTPAWRRGTAYNTQVVVDGRTTWLGRAISDAHVLKSAEGQKC